MMETKIIHYTDGWHPTVSPSARMAIHHFRYTQLLGDVQGILNEFPRRFGGSTIRSMRFSSDGIVVRNLCAPVEWVPWWFPASDPKCNDIVLDIYRASIQESRKTDADELVYERVLNELVCSFDAAVGATQQVPTIGEVVFGVLDTLHREITPELPKVRLISFTRSPIRHRFANTIRALGNDLFSTLAAFARVEERTHYPLLAVTRDFNNCMARVRYIAATNRIDIEPLLSSARANGAARHALTCDDLADLIEAGKLVPGLRLAAVAEIALQSEGFTVRHFGNAYGVHKIVGKLLGVPHADEVPLCRDDEDSWPFADLPRVDEKNARYPLHLLDIASCSPSSWANADNLIKRSLLAGDTIKLTAKPNLRETLFN
ncbi:MAG: hypothetical protein HZA93_07635 [Verrucomicrobia bacterium]|nr:hypothetical protein [Verrucomicrobiota bacterium]